MPCRNAGGDEGRGRHRREREQGRFDQREGRVGGVPARVERDQAGAGDRVGGRPVAFAQADLGPDERGRAGQDHGRDPEDRREEAVLVAQLGEEQRRDHERDAADPGGTAHAQHALPVERCGGRWRRFGRRWRDRRTRRHAGRSRGGPAGGGGGHVTRGDGPAAAGSGGGVGSTGGGTATGTGWVGGSVAAAGDDSTGASGTTGAGTGDGVAWPGRGDGARTAGRGAGGAIGGGTGAGGAAAGTIGGGAALTGWGAGAAGGGAAAAGLGAGSGPGAAVFIRAWARARPSTRASSARTVSSRAATVSRSCRARRKPTSEMIGDTNTRSATSRPNEGEEEVRTLPCVVCRSSRDGLPRVGWAPDPRHPRQSV